jgi:hypothetical protein
MSRVVGEGRDQLPPSWSYAACYGLYGVILVLCYVSFWTWRSTAEVVVGHVYRKADALNAVYLTWTLIAGLILFVLAVGSEPYLRRGLESPRMVERRRRPLQRLAERFAHVVVPLAGAMFFALSLQEWALTQAAATAAAPRPAVSARAGGASGANGTATAATPSGEAVVPSAHERGAGAAGGWIVGAALAVGGTILLTATRRQS